MTNILNMLVLFRHGMEDSTNIVLFGLSVTDLIFSCSETFNRIISIVFRLDFFLAYTLSGYYIVGFMNVSNYAMCTSVWMVSIISFERMLAVCFPFLTSTIITPKRMKFMVTIVYVVLAILYIPFFVTYDLDWGFDSRYNKTLIILLNRKEYLNNKWWIDIFADDILPALGTTVPMTTILFCTFATIASLRKATKNIGNLTTSLTKRVKEMRSIKISLIICCGMAFSVLIPNACLDAYPTIKGEYLPPYLALFIRSFTQVAVQFNASMNFFIYVALSSKFKKTCLKLIHWK
ncbi:unnamed protein product [Lymnaea stagnalis]|uniref:G-protein coupled receptors family 1 profile domain-containing protein n=1 Tax=Lymnaea stagnalis TaxID=6523 RepID=A0AAV2H626_LYMST